jgi:hypothetical protein
MACPIALHGLCCTLPAGCEVVATYGDWRRGHLVVAAGRLPRLALTWRRHRAAPDLQRTLTGAGRQLARGDVAGEPAGRSALGSDGLLGRWRSPDGDFHAGVRTLAAAGTTLVARQLRPGGEAEIRDLLGAAQAHGDAEPWPWRLYGLEADLPPWWRLEGVQQLAGLARAVWFHQPPGQARPDQVLVLRRLACAGRVLAGRTLESWLRGGLARGETVHAVALHPGGDQLALATSLPARSWWSRLRGRRATRSLHAWIDAGDDRLTLQEWRGEPRGGGPLPCLRRSAPAAIPQPCGAGA